MLSYRKLAMRVLGRPFHTGGSDSPRPASQRAAAFALTAAMLTTLAAPAFADIWRIEDGDITVKAGETEGTNKVSQGTIIDKVDTDTIITNQNKNIASSNTVTIEANDKDDKVEVTLKDVNIDASSRNEAAVSVTGSGNTTIKLDGDNHLTGGISDNGSYGLSGISSSGSLTISGGETDSLTAQGGSGTDGSGGRGIFSKDLTISGGTVNANGGDGKNGSGGSGITSLGSLTISGGTVNAAGGDGTNSSDGGDGITNNRGVTISSGGTVTAKGGSGEDGGSGISSFGGVTISSGGTVTATGGNSTGSDGSGGDGISSTSTTISGGTVTADGGSGNFSGGNGIRSFDVAISGGTVNAAGGNGNTGGGSSIYGKDIDLSGSLELTAKAGKGNNSNRPHLWQNGKELDLDTINKDKLDPGAKVTTTDADGKVIKQVSIPRPVEPEKPVIPEESSSSSDGGSSAPSAPVSSIPGLTVTDKSGAVISYTSTQSGNTLTVCVGRFTASLHVSLAALRQLRAEGIETIAFQTVLCSTTLSVDELLAMGGEDAEAVLTHRLTDSSLTVG